MIPGDLTTILQWLGGAAAVGLAALAVRAALRPRQGVAGRLAYLTDELRTARGEAGPPGDARSWSARLDQRLARFAWGRRLRQLIDASAVPIGIGDFLILTLALGGCAAAGGAAAGLGPLPWMALGVAAAGMPLLVLRVMRRRWEARIAAQLPEAIDLITRALRAGHSLQTGLQIVGEEMPAPIRDVFRRVHADVSLGARLEQSLEAMAQRVGGQDMNICISAMLIHRQVGGDLAEMLDKLAYVIRERVRLAGKVRALTAEGRLSGVILGITPVAAFAMLLLVNPRYMQVLLDSATGLWLLAAAVVLQVAGAWMIRRIVRLSI